MSNKTPSTHPDVTNTCPTHLLIFLKKYRKVASADKREGGSDMTVSNTLNRVHQNTSTHLGVSNTCPAHLLIFLKKCWKVAGADEREGQR